MAKEAAKFRVLPEDPSHDGCTSILVSATVAEGDSKWQGNLPLFVPELNGKGIVGWQKWYNSVRGADDPDANVFVAEAIRSAVRSSVISRLTPKTRENSLRVVPPPTSVRTIDAAQAAGDRLTDFMREHGRAPSAEELAEIYGGLIPGA